MKYLTDVVFYLFLMCSPFFSQASPTIFQEKEDVFHSMKLYDFLDITTPAGVLRLEFLTNPQEMAPKDAPQSLLFSSDVDFLAMQWRYFQHCVSGVREREDSLFVCLYPGPKIAQHRDAYFRYMEHLYAVPNEGAPFIPLNPLVFLNSFSFERIIGVGESSIFFRLQHRLNAHHSDYALHFNDFINFNDLISYSALWFNLMIHTHTK